MKKIYLTVFALFLLMPARITKAVDNSDMSQFTVTPAVYEVILQPGETKMQSFQLSNKSNVPLPIKSYVRVFEAADENGGVDIVEEPDMRRLSPTSWINIETKDFIIQPDSIYRANVIFSPPTDLPPGGYYATIFFEPQLPESILKNSNTLQINGRLGALLFLVGAGDIVEKAEISEFSVKKWNLSTGPIKFNATIANNGNVHLRPSGKIVTKNLLPFLGKESIINVDEITVLPGKQRQFKISDLSLALPGLYKSNISLIYGRDSKALNSEFTYIYLPWKYILLSLMLIIVVAYLSKRRNRRRLAKAAAIIEGIK